VLHDLRADTERWEHVLRLRAAAEQLGRPLLGVALQFSLRSPVSTTILGMSHADHLRADLTLLDAPGMTEEEISLLCAAAQQQVP
jgi:aryl-alcohol dehydrogenase-like predicted oxidoreductase